MTAPTQSRSTSTGPLQPMLALARMEPRIFFRNRTAVVNATLLPLGMAGFLALFGGGTGRAGVVVPIAMTISSCLLFVIYYSSVSSVVARRQSGVLKRLLTGTVDRPLILAALSLPLLALFAVEVLLGVVVATLAVGAVPVKPLLIPLAAVAGGLTWTLLGLASSLYTRTAESAQISTLPLMLGALLLSGLSIPVEWLPGPIRLLSELSAASGDRSDLARCHRRPILPTCSPCPPYRPRWGWNSPSWPAGRRCQATCCATSGGGPGVSPAGRVPGVARGWQPWRGPRWRQPSPRPAGWSCTPGCRCTGWWPSWRSNRVRGHADRGRHRHADHRRPCRGADPDLDRPDPAKTGSAGTATHTGATLAPDRQRGRGAAGSNHLLVDGLPARPRPAAGRGGLQFRGGRRHLDAGAEPAPHCAHRCPRGARRDRLLVAVRGCTP